MPLTTPNMKLALPAVAAAHDVSGKTPPDAVHRHAAAREVVRVAVVLVAWGCMLAFAHDIGRVLHALIH